MEITKKELKDWYNSMSNQELCKKLGISEPTLIKMIKNAGIPMKGKGQGGIGAVPKVRVI